MPVAPFGPIARLLIAFLLAPVSIGLVLLVISILQGQVGTGFWAVQLAALIGYPLAIVIGVPAHLILGRAGKTSLVSYLWMSLAPAAVLITGFIVWPIIASQSPIAPPHAVQVVLALAFSAASVAAFWFIARPDVSDGKIPIRG